MDRAGRLGEVPEAGLHLELEATHGAIRARAARRPCSATCPSCTRASMSTRRGAGLHVAGRRQGAGRPDLRRHARADDNAIDENVDLRFLAGRAPDGWPRGKSPTKTKTSRRSRWSAARSTSAPSPTEFLMLAIDPYPRKPGATFDAPKVGDDAPHPFAALAALKKNRSARSR